MHSINVHELNTASNYIKQKLTELKLRMDKSTFILSINQVSDQNEDIFRKAKFKKIYFSHTLSQEATEESTPIK